ncbi:MAG: DNA polymerase I, partial [Candidatus Accumulibacter sp.]|nr:DNA polymerase I [Accumulibacter sp.]
MPVLLLVDGSSYLYRAFHAMPDLRNAQGDPTGAIYGVLNMLRRLDNDYKARQIAYKACVFDARGKTFRNDWYPDYKANRPPMPDDLVRQIEAIRAGVSALGWPVLTVVGVEADDVIGTLARRAAFDGLDVVVSTGDKDLSQLVDEHITLVDTMRNEEYDTAGIVKRFGVPPGRIVDYLMLVGDAVDNVPGVPKVGPKTAIKWLNQYGSISDIIAAAGEIPGAAGENLRHALGFFPMSRKLLTIRCDINAPEMPKSFDALAPRAPDKAFLADFFTRYEMKSWLKEIQRTGSAADELSEAVQREEALSHPESPPSLFDNREIDRSTYET